MTKETLKQAGDIQRKIREYYDNIDSLAGSELNQDYHLIYITDCKRSEFEIDKELANEIKSKMLDYYKRKVAELNKRFEEL